MWQTCETQDFYYLHEAARILRMSVKELRSLCQQGKIVKHQAKPGGVIRIGHDDLVAYVQAMRVDVQPEQERGKK